MLENFLQDCTLTSWSVQSGSKLASITIRFRLDDVQYEELDTAKAKGVNVKYKRMSESQQARDKQRAKQWAIGIQDRQSHGYYEEVPKPHSTLTPESHIETPETNPLPQQPVSLRTRSRAGSSHASVQVAGAAAMSPVCQVDGPADNKHRKSQPPKDYSTIAAPGWAKAMIAGIDKCIDKAENIIDSDHSDNG